MRATCHDTPTGPLTLLIDDDDVVRAAGFTADAAELAADLRLDEPPPGAAPTSRADLAVAAYLDGDLAALAAAPIAQAGTDFQQAVWAALAAVPAGETASYADLARAVGRPAATRAVGSACGRNLLAPFVPCHRAIRTDGSHGGYRYGLGVKGWLLAHERGEA